MIILWAIAPLVCLGYFLIEALRAPVIEDAETDDPVDAPSKRSDARHRMPLVAKRFERPL